MRAEKVQPYEEAIKVPIVIRGPGVPAGVNVADPVANVDLAPTIMDLADASQPPALARAIDGLSLVPTRPDATRPAAILVEGKRPPHGRRRRRSITASWVGVRTQRYIYVEH